MMQHKATTLEGWVSKQHDGQITANLKKNYEYFGTFLKSVSKVIKETVNTMRDIANNPGAQGNCLQCTSILQKLIERAMESSAVHNYGGVKWMAYIAVFDLKEFVLEPFGPIDSSMIPVGVYSQRGHQGAILRQTVLFSMVVTRF
jgi:bacterioferritin-associated ferredoxin